MTGRFRPGTRGFMILVLVAPLILAVFVVARTSFREIDQAYQERLKAGLVSWEVIFGQKQDQLRRELSRIAGDDALKVTLALDMRAQLSHYLKEQFEGSGLDFIELVDPASEQLLAKVESAHGVAPEVAACTEDYRSLVEDSGRLYLTFRRDVVREGERLAVVCGGIAFSRTGFLSWLRETLDGEPFILTDDKRLLLLKESLKLPNNDLTPGKMVEARLGDAPVFAMTARRSGEGPSLELGLIVKRHQLQDHVVRIFQITLIVLLILASAGFYLFRNLREQRRAREELYRVNELASVTLSSIGDSVMTTDTRGWVNYMNDAAVELTGYSIADVEGKPWNQRLSLIEKKSGKAMDPVMASISLKRPIRSSDDVNLVGKRGQLPVRFIVTPIFKAGEVTGAVIVLHNTSKERELKDALIQQVNTDQLTGLFNRGAFCQQVARAIGELRNTDRRHALLCLDLDRFKTVNDSCGHQAGDLLLKQVSAIFRRVLRESDLLARLGGDEFGILLRDVSESQALATGEKLLEQINHFNFVYQQKTFSVGLSVGVAMIDGDSSDFEAVFHAADTACLSAKEKGRNRVEIHIPTEERQPEQTEVEWVPLIRDALRRDKLFLYVQPMRPAGRQGRGKACLWEVLVRILDDQAQVVSPSVFLPIAERYGLMPDIDRWVIEAVFRNRDIRSIIRAGARPESAGLISINLSGSSISQPDFLPFVMERIESHRIAPETVCFELSENTLSSHLDQASQFINELARLGCRFMIDDFGVGMTSFNHLRHLKVDFLKIDSAAAQNTESDPIGRSLVKAVIDVAQTMQIKTVAENVENDAVAQALTALGVDYLQGYGVGRPFPLDDFRQRMMRVVA